MTSKEKQNTIIVSFSEKKSFLEEITKIKNDTKYHQKNIIIDVLKIDISLDEIALIFPISQEFQHKYNKSFVLLTEQFSYEELPEELPSAPTLQEALDIIELEEIQRDLGF